MHSATVEIGEIWHQKLVKFLGEESIEYIRISSYPNYRGRWVCHACKAMIDDTNELETSMDTIPHFSTCVYEWTKEQKNAKEGS